MCSVLSCRLQIRCDLIKSEEASEATQGENSPFPEGDILQGMGQSLTELAHYFDLTP